MSDLKNWMPRQPVSQKQGLHSHPVSPKGVLLKFLACLKSEKNVYL